MRTAPHTYGGWGSGVRDVEEYERFFWDHLSKIENVQEIHSALTTFFETTRLPLSHVLVS